jgi:hypothetical protein
MNKQFSDLKLKYNHLKSDMSKLKNPNAKNETSATNEKEVVEKYSSLKKKY